MIILVTYQLEIMQLLLVLRNKYLLSYYSVFGRMYSYPYDEY